MKTIESKMVPCDGLVTPIHPVLRTCTLFARILGRTDVAFEATDFLVGHRAIDALMEVPTLTTPSDLVKSDTKPKDCNSIVNNVIFQFVNGSFRHFSFINEVDCKFDLLVHPQQMCCFSSEV